jgi:hypothetical protein
MYVWKSVYGSGPAPLYTTPVDTLHTAAGDGKSGKQPAALYLYADVC